MNRDDLRVTFRLKTGRDNDLIRWLENLPDDPGRSYAIRQALRTAAPSQRMSFKPTPLPKPGVCVGDTPLPEKQNTVGNADTIPPVNDVDLEGKLDSMF